MPKPEEWEYYDEFETLERLELEFDKQVTVA
jgi:hypothetical protein